MPWIASCDGAHEIRYKSYLEIENDKTKATISFGSFLHCILKKKNIENDAFFTHLETIFGDMFCEDNLQWPESRVGVVLIKCAKKHIWRENMFKLMSAAAWPRSFTPFKKKIIENRTFFTKLETIFRGMFCEHNRQWIAALSDFITWKAPQLIPKYSRLIDRTILHCSARVCENPLRNMNDRQILYKEVSMPASDAFVVWRLFVFLPSFATQVLAAVEFDII